VALAQSGEDDLSVAEFKGFDIRMGKQRTCRRRSLPRVEAPLRRGAGAIPSPLRTLRTDVSRDAEAFLSSLTMRRLHQRGFSRAGGTTSATRSAPRKGLRKPRPRRRSCCPGAFRRRWVSWSGPRRRGSWRCRSASGSACWPSSWKRRSTRSWEAQATETGSRRWCQASVAANHAPLAWFVGRCVIGVRGSGTEPYFLYSR
jgi:hypothetical protein